MLYRSVEKILALYWVPCHLSSCKTTWLRHFWECLESYDCELSEKLGGPLISRWWCRTCKKA